MIDGRLAIPRVLPALGQKRIFQRWSP